MKAKLPGVLLALFVLGAAPAFAHHGFNVEFDSTRCTDLKGTLTAVYWENPHAYFDMEVTNPDGKMVTWHLEMVTPNALKRTGTTKEDFKSNIGKTINAHACPSKVGDYRGAAGYIALSDGLIRLVGQLQGGRSDADKHF
jgi:uncharacterized protein YfaP (DUF2135 family)